MTAPSPGIRGLNNYRFNGQELQADLGLNWNHQGWRFLDIQAPHWDALDPEIENGQESWSPYSFGFDNALRYADANGRYPDGAGPGDPPDQFYGAKPDILNRAVLGIGISLVNLNGQMWAGLSGSSTKYAADYVYNAQGVAVDYQIKKVPVGSTAQELKALVADEVNLLTLAVGGGEGRVFEQAAGKVAAAEVSLEARATAIQNAQPVGRARNMSTTAVANATNADGTTTRLVGSSRTALSPAQRAALRPGETAVRGTGHAETTILKHAAANGQTVTEMAASRPICQNCQAAMQQAGVKPASALKPVKKVTP